MTKPQTPKAAKPEAFFCVECHTIFSLQAKDMGWASHTEIETLFCCVGCYEGYWAKEHGQ
jgi:uncharacterized protein with PIN domain